MPRVVQGHLKTVLNELSRRTERRAARAGDDRDWATFYSDWLLAHGGLGPLLGRVPVRSHLTRDLVELDERYTAADPAEPWPVWHARELVKRYR